MADTRGHHVFSSDFSLGNFEEDSAGFGVSRPPKKTDQSDRECIYDGRLSTPTVKFMLDTIAKCDPSKTNDKGGFGKVYFYKNKHHVLGIPVAIKEVIIEETRQKLKMMSTVNEKLASRTLHFAIVPLLAMTEVVDADKRAFYFLSPYLEKGDLFQMLIDDIDDLKTLRNDLDNFKGETDKLIQKQTEYQTLQKTLRKRRLKILYHISSALDFLHTPVKGIRGAIIHMDVKSLNIVLDADFNARLIDFGLAREMNEVQSGIPVTKTEVVGTDGYFPTRGYSVLTKYEDYHNFGVVGLECLTGLPPHSSTGKDLRVLHKSKLEDKIQQLWCLKSAISPEAKDILQLCIKCIASPDKKDVSSEEIMNVFLNHLRTFSVPRWDRKNKIDNTCEICLINPAVTDDLLSHASNCHCNIHVCIACIRNSYVNKIKCHSCDADIFPTIGHFWVALLIAGNDVKDSRVAESFLKDIGKVQKLIVSMCPMFIGIRSEDVLVIRAETCGEYGNLKRKLISAVEELSKRDNVKTIFVYYSGHSTKDGLDLENNDDYLSKNEFIGYMKQIVKIKQSETSGEFSYLGTSVVSQKRFLCFLDCCYPPNLTQSFDPRVTVIQVNASRSWQESRSETDGSIFTSFFIQALTRGAYGKKCVLDECDCLPLKGDIITVQQVIGYIRSHMKRYQQRRGVDTDNAPEKNEIHVTLHDEKIAYNIDFLIQLEFIFRDPIDGREMLRKRIQPHYISDMNELTRSLFATFMEKKFPNVQLEEEDIAVYQEGICIEIDMGSKKTEELETLERVLKAWSAKRDLIVTLRNISNIMRGMVLIQMKPGKIQTFLDSNGTVDNETCVYPVEGLGYSIPYAAINILRENIGRDTEGELQEFKSYLSDILDACKLEDKEDKDGSLQIIMSKSGEESALPFMCFKVTVFDKIPAENSLRNEDTTEPKEFLGTEETTEPKGLLGSVETTKPKGLQDSVKASEAKGLKDTEETTKPKEHVAYKESTESKGLKDQTETIKQKDLPGNKGRKDDLLTEYSRDTPRQEIIYERKPSENKDKQEHQYENKGPSESEMYRGYHNEQRAVPPVSDSDRRMVYQSVDASEEIPEYRMNRDPRGEPNVTVSSQKAITGEEFAKERNELLSQDILNSFSEYMKSVGALIYRGDVAGTVFRAGDSFVFTALHVIKNIIDVNRNGQLEASRLETEHVCINFNSSIAQQPACVVYRVCLEFASYDPQLDFAVLRITNPVQLPKKMFLDKYNFERLQVKKLSGIGYGHPGPDSKCKKNLDLNCEIIFAIDNRIAACVEWLQDKIPYYQNFVHENGANPALVDNNSYTGIDTQHNILLDITMEHGGSGSPFFDNEGRVLGILTHGHPEFCFNLPVRIRRLFPKNKRFESVLRLDYVYQHIFNRDTELADKLFGETVDQV